MRGQRHLHNDTLRLAVIVQLNEQRAQFIGGDQSRQLLQSGLHANIGGDAQNGLAVDARRGIATGAHDHQTRCASLLLYIALNVRAQLRADLGAHRPPIQNHCCHTRPPTMSITCWLPVAIASRATLRRSFNACPRSRSFIIRRLTRTIQAAPLPALAASAAPAAISLSTLALPISAMRRQQRISSAAHSATSSGTSAASASRR